ncbi:hypothetical protein [Streptomyces sp. NPDC058954]|uniref:hypothetical protein n=1 Tax=Streptomyces sp. NPDC058954 TaxID=3346677 RepID=UPI0036AF9F86
MDKTRVHGRGTVRLTVRDLVDTLAFDVSDRGDINTARPFERATPVMERAGASAWPGPGSRRLSLAGSPWLAVVPPPFTLLVPVDPHG